MSLDLMLVYIAHVLRLALQCATLRTVILGCNIKGFLEDRHFWVRHTFPVPFWGGFRAGGPCHLFSADLSYPKNGNNWRWIIEVQDEFVFFADSGNLFIPSYNLQ